MENVPQTGSFLLVANHQSNYDPIFVGTIAHDRLFTCIARGTLFKSKILSFLMNSFGVISINRGDSDVAAMRTALEVLESGRGILLFPEGTRSKDGNIGEFQRGFWLLLKKSRAPLLPVAIEGAFDVWPMGSKPKLFGRIESGAGELIPAKTLLDMGEVEGTAFIKEKIEELRCKYRKNIDNLSKQ